MPNSLAFGDDEIEHQTVLPVEYVNRHAGPDFLWPVTQEGGSM